MIFLIIISTILLCGIIYLATNGRIFKLFFHNFCGWHLPTKEITFDGCSCCSKCRICGKHILQDSQGGWF